MAFMSMKDYNEKHFGGLFLLRNDGDYADVVFMYRNSDDVLIADTHYVKSADYSGYVHCCQRECPACGKGIRVQTKLFIPLYNITSDGELQFWDRSVRFMSQLQKDVFERYPNPCDYVFRITRHGESGSMDTRYEIVAVGRNSVKTYDQILTENNASFPAYYENVCKEYSSAQLYTLLNNTYTSNSTSESSSDSMPNYTLNVSPRTGGVINSNPTAADIAALGLDDNEPLDESEVDF